MKKIILFLLSFLFIGNIFATNWKLEWINLITREQWWANDKFLFKDYKWYQNLIKNNERYIKHLKKNRKRWKKYLENIAKRKTRERYLLNHFRNEVRADKVIKTINWKKLRWNIAYKYHKTKIIIHHTAANYDRFKTKQDVEKYIKWVYYFHAIKRWWWDIWYNFLIDKFWNIYEWRKWWEWVIGANSKWNNVPSIWIALIWNFEIQKPTKKQIQALEKLIYVLSKKYKINPYKQVIYHKEDNHYPYIKNVRNFSIVGHKDTWHTSCPGKYVYQLLPKIRDDVYNMLKNPHFVVEKLTKGENIIKLWTKFTLTNKIILTNPKFKNIEKCDWNIKWIAIRCEKNRIILYRKYFVGIKYFNFYVSLNNKKYKVIFRPIFIDDIREIIRKKAEKYIKNKSNIKVKKIKYKVSLQEAKKFTKQNVRVLLYDLSYKNDYKLNCSNYCNLITDIKTFKKIKKFKVEKLKNYMLLWINKKSYAVKYIDSETKNGTIEFENYNRKSWAWIKWNIFRWDIIFRKDFIKNINNWKIENKFVVINELNFEDYLKWIAEVNDQVPYEYAKLMSLLAKSYLLFYFNKKNIHPSIPKNSSYNAIDDPRVFQKYVWAWYEKTSKRWSKILKETKNTYLVYENYIPILPYFSCSKWFTFSAKQKFHRIDTPYLVNNIDLAKCDKFYWHWVGLSWKWAQFLAKKWFKVKQILQWYFPGVKIVR